MSVEPTELDETRPKSHDSWNTRCLDTWLLEIFAAIFSIACFVALCAILIAYNGKTRPDLGYGLSLNAVISVLATGCKSSLLFAIGEALSQTKWIWFRRTATPLLDMQTFDSASRGPLGAMMLLFQRKRPLASLGAAVIVFLLAFDPFVQQITKYPTRPAPISDGSGAAVTKKLKIPNMSVQEWNMAYSSGLWSDNNLFHPKCSSWNCTWPVFRSVGICRRCDDVTTSVVLDCRRKPYQNQTYADYYERGSHSTLLNASCRIILPLGHSANFDSRLSISYPNETDWSASVYFIEHLSWRVHQAFENNISIDEVQLLDLENLTFNGVTNPLMVLAYAKMGYDMAFINSSNPVQGLKIEKVTQCSLTLCLGDWNISVNQGATRFEASNFEDGQLFWREQRPSSSRTLCWKPSSSPSDIPFDDEADSDVFEMSKTSPIEYVSCHIIFHLILQDGPFVGSSGASHRYSDGKITETKGIYSYRGNASTQRIASAGLEYVMSNVADAINKMALQASGEDINGTTYDIEVYVVVQWPWLILPGLLVICGIVFFVLTLLGNKELHLWKSSILPFLYHGLDDSDTADCPAVSSMEKKATYIRVQLRASHQQEDLKLKEAGNTEED